MRHPGGFRFAVRPRHTVNDGTPQRSRAVALSYPIPDNRLNAVPCGAGWGTTARNRISDKVSAMKLCILSWACAFGMLTVVTTAGVAADKSEAKTTEVKVKDITLTVPESWKQEKPSNNFRLAQFAIPAVEGDDRPADLSISSFPGGGGGVDPNLSRWISQFGGEGRKAKVTTGKSEYGTYYVADISGTFNDRNFRTRTTKAYPDSRMLGVILNVKDKGVYFIKLIGPDKTVAAASDELRAAFGGNAKTEKEHEIGG